VESEADATSGSGVSAPVEMAGPDEESDAPPTLVDNVETLANVPAIIARGAAWFRTEGTEKSPGTIVCTVTGRVRHPGVAEVMMGTPLREVIEEIGGGPLPGRRIKAVMSGVATGLLTADLLDTPVSYEAMTEAGGGLGSAGFMVFDDSVDMTAVAAGASRFLAVESCGQCPPCKLGSLEITSLLRRIESGQGTDADVAEIGGWLDKVTDGNRCYLAVEERVVIASILRSFPEEFVAHLDGRGCPRPRSLAFPAIRGLGGGRVSYDQRYWLKRPDWTYAERPEDAEP
jgi:NADH-quinone oxidoreductase subunit F